MNIVLVLVLALVLDSFCLPSRGAAAEAFWKAGLAKTNITPDVPLWLAGYASRTNPATGKAMDLWLKVLALQDTNGNRALILTSDTLGIPQSIYQHSCAALKEKFGLEPRQILLTASHTHCGPVLRNALYDAYPLDARQRELIEKYSTWFEASLLEVASQAMASLSPVRLAAGQGTTRFAVNRRNNPAGKVPELISQGALKGPMDHSVPVLAISSPDGALKAVLFGYACHNTVMSFDKWCGDYAGFAQIALEKSHPGANAMFFMGCGGDQNPLPRGRLEMAERYGDMLAAAVEEVLIAPPAEATDGLEPLGMLAPTLETTMQMVTLDFGPAPSESDLQEMKAGTNASPWRYATRLLKELAAGKSFPRSYPYPMQAWRFGGSQLLLTLGGEPVVDYAIKFKTEFGSRTWVAGYCNDVMTYIPSLRVLKEGGYEGGKAMIPYGQPALRWGDDVEELITSAARELVASLETGKR